MSQTDFLRKVVEACDKTYFRAPKKFNEKGGAFAESEPERVVHDAVPHVRAALDGAAEFEPLDPGALALDIDQMMAARMACDYAGTLVAGLTGDRAFVLGCTVAEHGANSATYKPGDAPIT